MQLHNIIQTSKPFPLKQHYIDMMNKAIKEKNFLDVTKGKINIDHNEIIPFFTELLSELGIKAKITRAWIHFMAPGSHHLAGHEHDSDVGIYYLQTPKGSSILRFDDLNVEIEPKEDMFVIVPKLEKHSMTTNTGEGIRIALGFPFERL